jgi:hypothetical protein
MSNQSDQRPRFKSTQNWHDFLNSSGGQIDGNFLLNLRKQCYAEIEGIRKRPLIVYATRFLEALPPNTPNSIDLGDVDGFTDLVNSIKDSDSIDVLIHSPGGRPDATERIVSILRNRFKEVHFLIPHSAYSAATMLALSGNSISIHPSATLGPIDPQINGTPARSIKRGFEKVREIIKKELADIKAKYGDERRTKLIKHGLKDFNPEDLIPDEESVLVLTKGGYIKRTNPDEYRKQKRGGIGVVDLDTKEEDFITHLVYATAHNDLLFFTDLGKAYQIKMYDIPEGKRATKGKSIMNFLSLSENEKVTSILPMPKNKKEAEGLALLMVTKDGTGKKSSAKHFHDVRRSGLIAITLDDKDELMSAQFVGKSDDIVIATKDGQSIRFKESDIREMGRNAAGVRVIKLGKGDEVISADVVSKDAKNPALFVMGSNGYGKKTKLDEYKVQNRGGSGILTMNVTDKTGPLMSAKVVTDTDEEIVAMSKKSQVIRVDIKEIPTLGRSTQGVRVMKLRDGDTLASLICL